MCFYHIENIFFYIMSDNFSFFFCEFLLILTSGWCGVILKDIIFTDRMTVSYTHLQGMYAIPGLIDLHFHGCMGDDFCDGDREALKRIAEYEASVGVTAIAPATMTLPVEELEHILCVAAAYKNGVHSKDVYKRQGGSCLYLIPERTPYRG